MNAFRLGKKSGSQGIYALSWAKIRDNWGIRVGCLLYCSSWDGPWNMTGNFAGASALVGGKADWGFLNNCERGDAGASCTALGGKASLLGNLMAQVSGHLGGWE